MAQRERRRARPPAPKPSECGDEIWFLAPAPEPDQSPAPLPRAVEVLPEPIVPSLTSVVRARCSLGHEWPSTVDRAQPSKPLDHPYCPDCGRSHISFSDLRHG